MPPPDAATELDAWARGVARLPAPPPEPRGRLVVVTFATPKYEASAAVLRHSALHDGGADRFETYGPADADAWLAERGFAPAQQRGYGFWAWKPWVICRALEAADEGDTVAYCDAAAKLEAPLPAVPEGAWASFFEVAPGYPNGDWTRPAAMRALGAAPGSDLARATQVNAALQMYRKCEASLAFARKVLELCGDPAIVGDDPADPAPRDHRHDQSVLSLLVARLAPLCPGLRVGADPTQHGALARPLVLHHRAALPPGVSVAVITATRGGPHLAACVRAVQAQTLAGVRHWVVADGPDCLEAVRAAVAEFEGRMPVQVLALPRRTGEGGWNGHRVYASVPWLVDADYVAYLDDDNLPDPDHLAGLVRAVLAAPGARWAYSLRRVVAPDGSPVCDDLCESLGGLSHTVLGPEDRLIDTSCYLLERGLACDVSPCWNSRFRDPARREADRALAATLLAGAPGACVPRHTLAYRLGSTPRSVPASFFLEGNARSRLDSRKPFCYLFHFSPDATARFLAALAGGGAPAPDALLEWQMTLWRDLARDYNLVDGYANIAGGGADMLPPGSLVAAALCHPDALPLDFLRRRTDLRRVVYTLESPNIRHQAQWRPDFLRSVADAVLTYWEPLLAAPELLAPARAVFCPHNTHHLDLPRDAALLADPPGPRGPGCVMVLERRDLRGEFEILPGLRLRCLDGLRETYVRGLRDATAFGVGWDAAQVPGLKVGHALHRSRDPRTSVDIMREFSVAVIVENVNAEGYVSEKFYDALIAGCVPAYYGNFSGRLLAHLGLGPRHALGPDDGPDDKPEAFWIDLRLFRDGQHLQAWLDRAGPEGVALLLDRVRERREAVLERVGVRAFGAAVREAVACLRD